jgi:hypothetical protein
MTAHRTLTELQSGLDHIRAAPSTDGVLEMIVVRPAVDERRVLEEARLDPASGVDGDSWHRRPSSRTADGTPHPDMQLDIMSARVIALLAGDRSRWPLAGDQLYVDLDLSEHNAPPGTRYALGSAVIELTDQPHRGCAKFAARYGRDALRFVNSAEGRTLRLRGANARVVGAGTVRRDDVVSVL